MSLEPEQDWKLIPAWFGLPVELDEIDGVGPDKPWFTWATAFVVATVSILTLIQGALAPEHYIINEWGLIPKDAWRHHGLTFITSFFLHGSVWHLVSNLYFLIVFGGSVERYAGSLRWLLIIGVATLIGGGLDVAIETGSALPLIGASGGISGLLVYYGLEFPRAQVGVTVLFEWKEFSAWRLLVGWVLLQIAGSLLQVNGGSHVASLAHLGGGIAGAVFWLIWKVCPFDSAGDAFDSSDYEN